LVNIQLCTANVGIQTEHKPNNQSATNETQGSDGVVGLADGLGRARGFAAPHEAQHEEQTEQGEAHTGSERNADHGSG